MPVEQPQVVWAPVEVQEVIEPPKEEPESFLCSCVAAAIHWGANIPFVNASDIIPNQDHPNTGGVVIMKYSNGLYHVALIEGISEDELEIRDGNYKKCTETRRTIRRDATEIIGYYWAK